MPDVDFSYKYAGYGIKWTDERLDKVKEALEQTKEEERHVGEPESPYLRKDGNGYISRETGEHVTTAVASVIENIALEDADRLLKGRPVMPEDESVTVRFPGISPIGKTCAMEMQFAQRIANIKVAIETCPPEVAAYANSLLAMNDKNKKAYGRITAPMKLQMDMARVASRAAKICPSVSGRTELRRQSRKCELEAWTERFELYLQGIEHAVGIDPRPELPEEVHDLYRETLQTELDMELHRRGRETKVIPPVLHVEFDKLEDNLIYRAAIHPDNWDLSEEELRSRLNKGPAGLKSLHMTEEEVDNAVVTYARATVDRVLQPTLGTLERTADARLEFSRGDYIIVDGQTVREKMVEDYLAENRDLNGFERYYAENIRQKSNEYVAAALMAGKRVETFVPDRYGHLPKEPTQLVKAGYEPTRIQKVTLNAWERFFAKRGFYKQKAAKAAEYQRFEEARRRVRLRNFLAGTQLDYGSQTMRESFFGDWAREHNGVQRAVYDANEASGRGMGIDYSVTRSADFSTAVCYMAALGHNVKDILDPTKLQAERQAAGAEVMRRFEAYDHNWITSVLYHGQIALAEFMDDFVKETGLHIEDENALFRDENRVLFTAAKVAFDANQEIQKADKKGFYDPVVARSAADKLEGLNEEQKKVVCENIKSELWWRVNKPPVYLNCALDSLQTRLGIVAGDELCRADRYELALGKIAKFEAMRRDAGGRMWGKESRAPELMLRNPATNAPPVSLTQPVRDMAFTTCFPDGELDAINTSVQTSIGRTTEIIEQKKDFLAHPEKLVKLGHESLAGEMQKKCYVELRGESSTRLASRDIFYMNAPEKLMKPIRPKVDEKKAQPQAMAPNANGRTR